MAKASLQLLQAAQVLLHISLVESQRDLWNWGAFETGDVKVGASAFPTLFPQYRYPTWEPSEAVLNDDKRLHNLETTTESQAYPQGPLGSRFGTATTVPKGSRTGREDAVEHEWVQLFIEGRRMALNAKAVGKITPMPPAILHPGRSQNLQRLLRRKNIFESEAAATTPADSIDLDSPYNKIWLPSQDVNGGLLSYLEEDGSPAADTPRLEVPSKVQLVVQVEKLQKGSPVLYAFRWGKPASWKENDYLLEVRQEGVYVLELREPLMFSNVSKRQPRALTYSDDEGQAVFARTKTPHLVSSAAHPGGFRRFEGALGCRPYGFEQKHNVESRDENAYELAFKRPTGWAGREGLKGPRVRASAVPLYYTILFAPPRHFSDDGSKPLSFMQHSLCFVFSGLPMLQLLPLDGTSWPSRGLVDIVGTPDRKEVRSPQWSAPNGAPAFSSEAFSTSWLMKEWGEPQESSESLSRPQAPTCTNVSQLPVLDRAAQLDNLSNPVGNRQKPRTGALQQASDGTMMLHGVSAFGGKAVSAGYSPTYLAAPKCGEPYEDYVYYADPMQFSFKFFNAEAAKEACRKAWGPSDLEMAAEVSTGPWASDAQIPAELPCHGGAVLGQRRGRQLLQAPSLNFVWRQIVSFDVAQEVSKPVTPDEIWDLLKNGQSPCTMLGFRAAGAPPRPNELQASGHPLARETTADVLLPLLNSCSVLPAAVSRGLVTPTTLAQPGGVAWRLPRDLVPEELQVGSGHIVYRLQLVEPVNAADRSISTAKQQGHQLNSHLYPLTNERRQRGQLWILQQAFEVREPGFGEWRLRFRRKSAPSSASPDEAPRSSVADALTFFVSQSACSSVIAAAEKRSKQELLHSGKSSGFTARQGMMGAAENFGPSGSATVVSRFNLLQEVPPGGLPPHTAPVASPTVSKANRDKASNKGNSEWKRAERQELQDTSVDCNWCSKAVAAFARPSTFNPYTLQLELSLGATSLAELPRVSQTISKNLIPLGLGLPAGGSRNSAAGGRWKPVGPPVVTSLSLTAATASGGRHLSVNVDLWPFAASRGRRCSPLLSQSQESRQGESGRLYFYAIDLRVARDAAPPSPDYWDDAPVLEAKENGRPEPRGMLSASPRRAMLRLPVFCGDPYGPEDSSVAGAATSPLRSRSWNFKSEILPADWNWQPTTYLLQWQLLETENGGGVSVSGALKSKSSKNSQGDEEKQQSDADVWLRLIATSEVSTFCSQPCPSRSSCAITDRLDGFAVFDCRCAYGYSGAKCEYEYMTLWLRLLAQGALVFSNFAMLPTFFLCVRLALRHLNLQGTASTCPACASRQGELQPASGPLSFWQKNSCFVLYIARALAYFNACERATINLPIRAWLDRHKVLWSALYHACVDASTRLPVDAQVLQSLDFLFSYYALLVTALALSDIGSSTVELVALVGGLAFLGVAWLPETLEQRSAVLFVTVCVVLPMMSFGLKAISIWKQAKRAEERQRAQDLKVHLGGWEVDAMKWLDSPPASEADMDTPIALEMQDRHQELQLRLRQRMDDAREGVCLAAIGQAIARLEVARKCPVALCCSTDPSARRIQTLLGCVVPSWDAHPPSRDDAVKAFDCFASRQMRRGFNVPPARNVNKLSCVGIAVTQVVPRVEFFALGVFLAVFGLGCFGVPETNDNYWLLHSLWHITIQSATCFILLARLHHPTLHELKRCEPHPENSKGSVNALPSRSLSEVVATTFVQETPSLYAAAEHKPLPLATAFWRALQQNQSRLVAIHLRRQAAFGEGNGESHRQHLLGLDLSPSLWPNSYASALGGHPSHSNLQQFLPALVWLLVLQYSAHKKRHEGFAEQGQQQSETSCSQPSPTEGEEGLVRVGTAESVRASCRSPRPGESQDSEQADWTCLWCAAKGSLHEVEMLRVHEQRLLWACRLRLLPSLGWCLVPRWLWGPWQSHPDEIQSDIQSPRASILFCS